MERNVLVHIEVEPELSAELAFHYDASVIGVEERRECRQRQRVGFRVRIQNEAPILAGAELLTQDLPDVRCVSRRIGEVAGPDLKRSRSRRTRKAETIDVEVE